MSKENGFWKWKRSPGKDAVKTVEMTRKDLEYYKTWLIKQWQGLRGFSPTWK